MSRLTAYRRAEMKCGSFSASYPRTDSSTQRFQDPVHISNVTGWNDRPSQKHNLLAQNIYTEADRHHLQQVHSRNPSGNDSRHRPRALIDRNTCEQSRRLLYLREVLNSTMNFLAVLHVVILISVCEILGKHQTSGEWVITCGDVSFFFTVLLRRNI